MRCSGMRKGSFRCLDTLYKCKKCGSVGCGVNNDDCLNKTFDKVGRCLKCGSWDKEEVR